MGASHLPNTEYSLEYFRSYEGFLREQSLSPEALGKELSESSHYDTLLKLDMEAIQLLQKIGQRHVIPYVIKLAIDDVAPRPNYPDYSETQLAVYGWHQLKEWMKLGYGRHWDDASNYEERVKIDRELNDRLDKEIIELRQQYQGDCCRASDDYLKTLQPSPNRASRVYQQLLPDAEKYRFKSALTNFMKSYRSYIWTANRLLILRRKGEAVYFPQRDTPYHNFLGELLLQGPPLLEDAVEGRIKKSLRQVDWHDRILDKLEESGIFKELRRKVRYASWEIDAVGIGQPFARVAPDSIFVLEAKPTLNHNALGQIEWYQHIFASQTGTQPHKGIVCEHLISDEFLSFCCHRGIAVFLVSYNDIKVYEPQ